MDLARAPRRTARKKGSGYENERTLHMCMMWPLKVRYIYIWSITMCLRCTMLIDIVSERCLYSVYNLSTLGSREFMSSCSNQIITDFKPRLKQWLGAKRYKLKLWVK